MIRSMESRREVVRGRLSEIEGVLLSMSLDIEKVRDCKVLYDSGIWRRDIEVLRKIHEVISEIDVRWVEYREEWMAD